MKVRKNTILAEITGSQAVIRFLVTHLKDATDVLKVSGEIEQIANSYDVRFMVLNFGNMKHVTSNMISRLLTLNKLLKELKIQLRLSDLSPDVEKAFRICSIHKIIPIYPSEDDALMP